MDYAIACLQRQERELQHNAKRCEDERDECIRNLAAHSAGLDKIKERLAEIAVAIAALSKA